MGKDNSNDWGIFWLGFIFGMFFVGTLLTIKL